MCRRVSGLSHIHDQLQQPEEHTTTRQFRCLARFPGYAAVAALLAGLFAAARVYPGRADSLGVSLRAQGSNAVLKQLDAWTMKSIYAE